MTRGWLLPLLTSISVACAATPANSSSVSSASGSTEPTSDDAPPATAAGASTSEAPPELPGAPPVTDPGWDFHAWAYARELKVELVSDGCEAAKLGDKPDETVWCAHHQESKEGAALYTRALYVARNKRLLKLVEIPIAVGVVDNPDAPRDEQDRHVMRLRLTPPKDGKSVSLEAASGFDCEKALKDNDTNKASARDLTRALDERIKKVCAARGEWIWAAGTLRHGAGGR